MSELWCAGAGSTHPGPRSRNEDAFLSSGPVHVVADGMGGHLAGAAASAAVVEEFRALADLETVGASDVVEAIQRGHEAVEALSVRVGGPSGTTLTGAVAIEHDGAPWWMVLNVGDSRVYLLEGGVLSQITVDHSHVQELVDRGRITPDEAEVHPDRHLITQAMGDGRRTFDAWLVRARPGMRLIIASDGLPKALAHDSIASIASLAGGAPLTAARLVDTAVRAGATDNVTVVAADVLHARTGSDADPEPWPEWAPWSDGDDTTTLTGRGWGTS